LGQNQEEFRASASTKRVGGRPLALERERPDATGRSLHFPDAKGGLVDTGNYHRRMLHKLAKDLELPKQTFRVIWRTVAMLAQKKGTV
jgi:hypothetical protein